MSDAHEPQPCEIEWIDTHCHLQLADGNPDASILRAPNVVRIVVPGVDLASSEAAIELAARYPGRLFPTVGLHPHEASRWAVEGDAIADLESCVVAIGETGLDFYRTLSPRDAQVDSFRSQIQLAVAVGKPLIVHCRDAFAEVHDLLEAQGAGPWVVLHCWTGGPRWSKRFSELGVTFSFAGPVAFETGDTVRRGAAVIDPSAAMVETDTPYLSPPPHRGEDNEPSRVGLIGEALAAVWGMSVEEVAVATTAKAKAVFSL